jgi:hypothetical protein
MPPRLRSKLTYANVVATLCLFIVLGGSSYAAMRLGKNAVKGTNIAANAVTSPKVKNGSLLGADFKAGQLPSGPRGAAGPKGDNGDRGTPGQNGTNGTDGTNGATNVTWRTATGTPSTTESQINADCLPGEVATGGGVLWSASVGAIPVVKYSYPDGDTPNVPTRWQGGIRNVGDVGAQVTAITYVVCAAP